MKKEDEKINKSLVNRINHEVVTALEHFENANKCKVFFQQPVCCSDFSHLEKNFKSEVVSEVNSDEDFQEI